MSYTHDPERKLAHTNKYIVYRGTFKSQGVAVKIVKHTGPKGVYESVEKDSIYTSSESAKLQHKNLVKFYGLQVKHQPDNHEYALLEEYMGGGALDVYLRNNAHSTEGAGVWKTKRSILEDVLSGLQYLSSERNGLPHNHIQASNVYLTTDMRAKLGHVGIHHMKDECVFIQNTFYLPTHHAPERFPRIKDDAYQQPAAPDEKTDVWSFGMLIYELCMDGELPFGVSYRGTLTHIAKAAKSEEIGRQLSDKDLPFPKGIFLKCDGRMVYTMYKCLEFDPQQRGNFAAVKQHYDSFESSTQQCTVIRRYYHRLMDMDAMDVADYLYEKGMFNKYEHEWIQELKHRIEKARYILDYIEKLPNAGEAVSMLRDALRERTKHDHLGDMLQ